MDSIVTELMLILSLLVFLTILDGISRLASHDHENDLCRTDEERISSCSPDQPLGHENPSC